jgi:regulatory protein
LNLQPQQPLEQDDAIAVEGTAIRLLASREHTRFELRRKLGRRHADGDLIEAVLDDLEQRRLLSDERFAEGYVEQRSRKGFGPLRIRAELAERGIGGELSSRWLDDGPHDWNELLAEAAVRKFGEDPATDMRALAKRGRFLEQRGFPIGLVRRYLDRVRDF